MNEPVADESRSLLDGHIILSRKLASAGRYPAIDILASASRVLTAIADPAHVAATVQLRNLMSKYQEIELLVQIGEYAPGSDALADEALDRKDAIETFLKQATTEQSDFETTRQALLDVVGHG
jgi:ATP synthase in type III secretion protein N